MSDKIRAFFSAVVWGGERGGHIYIGVGWR